MTLAIEAVGLVKRFGKTLAVDGVDLAVRPGMVLGLLGPNGAGKTTVVRMLATLLRPDAGYALVCGADIVQQANRVRELIGLTGQYAAVDEDLTGFENLLLIGRLLEVPSQRDRGHRPWPGDRDRHRRRAEGQNRPADSRRAPGPRRVAFAARASGRLVPAGEVTGTGPARRGPRPAGRRAARSALVPGCPPKRSADRRRPVPAARHSSASGAWASPQPAEPAPSPA